MEEEELAKSPQKKLKSPVQDGSINPKTSVLCTKVPDSLFESEAALKHFNKFGRVQKIKLYRKRQLCLVEYDQPKAAELAVLNAGAYDGFMFDVTRRIRIRRKSKRDDDPDWMPDPDIENELSAMSGAPSYRITRQKSMDIDPQVKKRKAPLRVTKLTPVRKKIIVPVNKPTHTQPQPSTSIAPILVEPPVVSVNLTTLNTTEAATELHQLSFKVSLTPDEQWRTLDARDRILRSWGGAGSRVKVGGATIGTCPDMCPEKEILHRQSEHQLMTLETIVDSDGVLEPWRAVKQYSRSSADQEIPMCYELRPAPVLMQTCAYLLHEIADTNRQVSLADWFHFMWDRFRGIRKDITQQALCCAESIRLVEMCARFHAHCAARLADLEHTQFDQRLNTDNLTKCLQTLKHMYADVAPEQKPNEAEFRGYIALLNLGDSNFLWEIKHLSQEIQKSEPIVFAIQVFIALDNNNYVRFFRLVRDRATYLQACILLRYFNDVRARALARIVKGFAPRGGSRYPAEELMNTLAFESLESMKSFVNHYGLRLARTDTDEIAIILNRNQFIEDSDPYPIARAVALIETKRQSSVGEVIAGGKLPKDDFLKIVHSSFNSDGKLKVSALTAEDLGYNTINDSNKDVQALKAEIQRFLSGGRNFVNERTPELKRNIFLQSEQSRRTLINENSIRTKSFSFQPAIPIAPRDIGNISPEKAFETDTKNLFTFSKPGESPEKEPVNIFKSQDNMFGKTSRSKNIDPFGATNNLFKVTKPSEDLFKKSTVGSTIFGQKTESNPDKIQSVGLSTNVFASPSSNLFSKKEETAGSQNLFKANIFLNVDNSKTNEKVQNQSENNIFGKPTLSQGNDSKTSNIFGSFTKSQVFEKPSLFQSNTAMQQKTVTNGSSTFAQTSPGNLFKNALNTSEPETKTYSIFQSKNKPSSVASNIFNSVNAQNSSNIYEFDQNIDGNSDLKLRTLNEQSPKFEEEQRKIAEKLRKEEEENLLQQRLEEKRKMEAKRKEEERVQKEKEAKLEELRKKEEEARKQEQLKKKLEEERQAEMQKKAEEEKRFKERVDKESKKLTNELVEEIEVETVKELLEIERDNFTKLMLYAKETTEGIFTEVCNEICHSEIKAEIFLNKKLMKKWFNVWKKCYIRNVKRRNILEDTPVWLTDNTPNEEARHLRRRVQNAALRNMNAIHKGYRFSGELKQIPTPEPFNVMEIIRSSLLKRLREINYPYDKCFFWKVTVLSPGADTWLCRKVRIEKWLQEAFSDKKTHEESDCLIYVGKQSWNQLMDFAISITLINQENKTNYGEALEGTNSLLLYITELNITEAIEEIMKQKYSYQKIPVAILTPIATSSLRYLELQLMKLKNSKNISDYRIYIIDSKNLVASLSTNTKRALKWLARNYPSNPPIEIDHLKSVCQRFLGNEIWLKLKFEKDERMNNVLKDLSKLVECYNIAVEKLTEVITNEHIFNYPSFPLEFKNYLDSTSPYPKPYEFIPSNVKNTENAGAIRTLMDRLKLPLAASKFDPIGSITMQEQLRKYCYQIGWFDNPERVVCKVVALLPDEYSQIDIPCPDFSSYFEQHDFIDLLNIIVYEKINRLGNFENRYVIYEKSALENYRNTNWIYETNALKNLKHKALDYEDELDLYINAKRRKIEFESQECLTLQESDVTLVEKNIQIANKNISQFNSCKDAVQQLEEQLEEERKKSYELENLLKAALCDEVL